MQVSLLACIFFMVYSCNNNPKGYLIKKPEVTLSFGGDYLDEQGFYLDEIFICNSEYYLFKKQSKDTIFIPTNMYVSHKVEGKETKTAANRILIAKILYQELINFHKDKYIFNNLPLLDINGELNIKTKSQNDIQLKIPNNYSITVH